MLRVRSGGSGPQPPADRDAELASIVAAAQAELDRAIQVGGLQNDPLRHTMQALSVHLTALHKVLLGFNARIDAVRQPVQDEILRGAMVQGVNEHARTVVRALNITNWLLGAVALVAMLLTGAGIGYWFRGAAPILVGVHAGAEKCDNRADGSRLCWIPIWERLPSQQTGSRSEQR